MAFPDLRGGDLEHQVTRLAGELSSLRKLLAKHGAGAYDDTRETASDLYSDLRDRFTEALPFMRRRAHAVEEVARNNPATAAAVGLVVVGLLVTLLLRNSGGSEPEAKPTRRSKR
jgi:ElaB/YqjD/DUF883 family membrane-anchored ribosome-binding protein